MRTKEYSQMPLIIDNSYLIEDSNIYSRVKSGGIKSVEFIRRRKNKLLFIEAKDTFSEDKPTKRDFDFDTESLNVVKKFLHSLNLFSAISLKVESDDISAVVNDGGEPTLIQLILIIQKTDLRECEKIGTKLTEIIKQDPIAKKIWRPVIKVMPYEIAVKKHLAVNVDC
jgi:hypothetical protein